MSTLTIMIGLILLTLASTTVSMFWMSVLRGKLLLLMLAVCSSAGAIYAAFEMERRAASTSSKLEHMIVQGNSVPNGFEDALLLAANQIAAQENYSQATLQETASKWNSEQFGYVVAFSGPSIDRPLTGYEELSILTGYAHAFAYVSKLSAGKLMLTFLEGGDLKKALEERTLWVWENADMTDDRFLQSMQGIAYLAYSAATSSQNSHEFQRHPKKFWIDLDINGNEGIEVLLRMRDPADASHGGRVHLGYMSRSALDDLIGIDALTRGGRIFYRLFEKMFSDWADPEHLPVVEGR